MYEFSPGTSSTSLEAGLEPSRVSLDVSRQSRWILKECCNTDFEVYAKEFDNLCTYLNTWKHLYLMMVTKPRVKRCRQYLQCNHPNGVITRHFHIMAQNECDPWARRNDCLLPSPQWRSVVRPKQPKERNQRGALTLEQGLSKSI